MSTARYRLRLVLGVALIAVGCANLAQLSRADPTRVEIANAASLSRADPSIDSAASTVPTVRILAKGCRSAVYGSGTILASGRILTARHVVEEAVSIEVEDERGRRYRAAGAIYDAEGRDVAVVSVPGLTAAGASMAGRDPAPGTAVSVIGHPQGGALHTEVGRVNTFTTNAPLALDGRRVMILDTMFAEGMSGGPVVDPHDRVIAVAVGVETRSRIGLTVPITDVRALLAGSGIDLRVLC